MKKTPGTELHEEDGAQPRCEVAIFSGSAHAAWKWTVSAFTATGQSTVNSRGTGSTYAEVMNDVKQAIKAAGIDV
jgi:hypothetical protein